MKLLNAIYFILSVPLVLLAMLLIFISAGFQILGHALSECTIFTDPNFAHLYDKSKLK